MNQAKTNTDADRDEWSEDDRVIGWHILGVSKLKDTCSEIIVPSAVKADWMAVGTAHGEAGVALLPPVRYDAGRTWSYVILLASYLPDDQSNSSCGSGSRGWERDSDAELPWDASSSS